MCFYIIFQDTFETFVSDAFHSASYEFQIFVCFLGINTPQNIWLIQPEFSWIKQLIWSTI